MQRRGGKKAFNKWEPLSKSFSVSYVAKCFAPPPLLRSVWCLSGSDKAAFWAVLLLGTHCLWSWKISSEVKKKKKNPPNKQHCKSVVCAVGKKLHGGTMAHPGNGSCVITLYFDAFVSLFWSSLHSASKCLNKPIKCLSTAVIFVAEKKSHHSSADSQASNSGTRLATTTSNKQR